MNSTELKFFGIIIDTSLVQMLKVDYHQSKSHLYRSHVVESDVKKRI